MLDADGAARLASRHFDIRATATALDGELDLNFKLASPGSTHLLKVHRAAASTFLDFQDAMLRWIRDHDPELAVPAPLTSVDGKAAVPVTLDGETASLRCLTWLDGTLWSSARIDSLEGPWSLGRYLARLDRALAGFSHPAAQRELSWDMRRAGSLRVSAAAVQPATLAARVEAILERFESVVRPRLESLPLQVIHNDANDNNIVVGEGGAVVGLIDYGDAVAGHRVTEVAVACAYAMCGSHDPAGVAAKVVAGYHSAWPLSVEEISLLPDLVATRIAMSVVMAARQHAEQPGNDYLLVSQAPFRALLDSLADENPDLFHYRLRDACGFSPHPDARRVEAWLRAHRPGFAPLCNHDLRDPATALVFDLSLDGPHALAMRDLSSTDEFTRYLFDRMAAAGATVGIGRFLEKRGVYQTDAYRTADPGERRDRHLGVDLFVPAGEPVRAPIEGVVEALANNDAPQDFGPTVILRHATNDGTPFWTLYGHLAPETLAHLAPGQRVRAGDVIGWVGDYPVNGDWPPHLHFQVMTSLLGMGTGIVGVGNDALLDTWRSVFLDPSLVITCHAPLTAPIERSPAHLQFRRRVRMGRMLSLAGPTPLKITRGHGQYLFDHAGRRYLDMVNNVCHVGHCHPRVVAAGQRQMAVLNTNTRYLHDHVIELADRLAATLPDPLSVCFFVNSGSEANDLALRLARAHTGERDVLVLDHGYHGNLSSLVDVSPYKFDGNGGEGRPRHVHVCPLPDTLRGPWRRDDPDAAARYAATVGEAVEKLRASGRRPAAFIAESIGGVSGQLFWPDGYLARAYRHAREGGAVCIADEVQVGLGRMGRAFWGFETQDAVPDIVTIGKPLGNGHPVAAVVTTAAIAESFDTGMEYFNTFGGNPVSSAIALAVLDAIVADDLVHNARQRGEQLLNGLAALAERHPLIGDVRGIGLFAGCELVHDRESLTPAADAARSLVAHARHRGILLSTEGPYDNVLKIKPPLCIDSGDVDAFIDCLDEGLSALA